jgi:hypothetical protein
MRKRDDVHVDILQFDEQRFHCVYVPEDASMCVCGERECLDFCGITIESGVGEKRDALSFVCSFTKRLE